MCGDEARGVGGVGGMGGGEGGGGGGVAGERYYGGRNMKKCSILSELKLIPQAEFWDSREKLESPSGRAEWPSRVHMPYDVPIQGVGTPPYRDDVREIVEEVTRND